MNTTSNQSRILSAAMAATCSLVLLAALGQTLNPSRLAAMPHVVEFERVVVTAPAQPAMSAEAAARTATN